MSRYRPMNSNLLNSAIAIAALTALTALGGCQSTSGGQTPALTAAATDEASRQMAFDEATKLAQLYQERPGDLAVGFRFASTLKKIGSHDKALQVLGEIASHHPENRDAVSAYGKALAEAGRGSEANEVLARAQALGEPDWKLISARGLAYDQSGQYQAAQEQYARAAELAPQEPTIYNNWGLSHALAGNLDEAEAMLTRAAGLPGADKKVRANLALVLGLQGRFDEAEQVSAIDMAPATARANAAYLREMLRQPDSWERLREGEGANGGAA